MHGNRILTFATAIVLPLTLLACGGDEAGQAGAEESAASQQETAQQQAELTMPDWMDVDQDAETVTIQLVAGQTDDNNSWNYNGYHSGNATVVVPQGYEVTLEFENADQVNPHSVGVDSQVGGYPATYEEVTPAFDGAVTEGATEMAGATQPGQSETITFTVDAAGEYALVCYVPAHANQGMWIGFDVSAEGEAGVRVSQQG